MDPKPYLRSLNEAQLRAVTHDPSIPLQILAGPGSGKTRVLTSRVAHLVQEHNVPATQICCVTFTNKAANEMRHRLKPLIGEKDTENLIMGTFHAICCKYLRKHGMRIGLPSNFSICDSEEGQKIMKKLIKEKEKILKAKKMDITPRFLSSWISQCKSKAETLEQVSLQAEKADDDLKRIMVELYSEYEENLQRQTSLDFDDLLLYGLNLFLKHPDIVESCEHILVDEFQDTSILQYQLVKLFAKAKQCISIVGDPDQSIYGWRSAEIENLSKMQKDFEGTQQIFLEENYRSTGSILAVSHAIMAEDKHRIDKGLFTSQASGSVPSLLAAVNEHDEANIIACEIKRLIAYSGGMLQWNDFAVLLRYNALSRTIEAAFQRQGIPVRMLAGQRFFERVEVKDILAYLQLADNLNYNPAVLRIINVPARGLGPQSVIELEKLAKAEGMPIIETAEKLCAGQLPSHTNRTMTKLKTELPPFLNIITTLKEAAEGGASVPDLIRKVVELVKYEAHLHKSQNDGDARWENIQELINFAEETASAAEAASQHASQNPSQIQSSQVSSQADEGETPLRVFLQNSSLATDTETDKTETDVDKRKVTISTCHAAKGLEWPVVFVPSVEDGTFPFHRNDDRDEERRLLYVACTRAQGFLYLSHTNTRMVDGTSRDRKRSDFIVPLLAGGKTLFSLSPPVLDHETVEIGAKVLNRSPPTDDDVDAKLAELFPNGNPPPASVNYVRPQESRADAEEAAPKPYDGPPPTFTNALNVPRSGPTGSQPFQGPAFTAPKVNAIPGTKPGFQPYPRPVGVSASQPNNLMNHFQRTTGPVRTGTGPILGSQPLPHQRPAVLASRPASNAVRAAIAAAASGSKPVPTSVSLPGPSVAKENQPTGPPVMPPPQIAGGKRRLGMRHIPDGFGSQPANKKPKM